MTLKSGGDIDVEINKLVLDCFVWSWITLAD